MAKTVKISYSLDEGAFKPEKAHTADAGFDLRTPVYRMMKPNDSIVVDTGVHMYIPEGYCGLLVSKSGLNVKNSITGTGLIDAGYTGSIVVKLYSDNKDFLTFNKGDKIIQIIILPVPEVELTEVATETAPETERGDNGFGSTGK